MAKYLISWLHNKSMRFVWTRTRCVINAGCLLWGRRKIVLLWDNAAEELGREFSGWVYFPVTLSTTWNLLWTLGLFSGGVHCDLQLSPVDRCFPARVRPRCGLRDTWPPVATHQVKSKTISLFWKVRLKHRKQGGSNTHGLDSGTLRWSSPGLLPTKHLKDRESTALALKKRHSEGLFHANSPPLERWIYLSFWKIPFNQVGH